MIINIVPDTNTNNVEIFTSEHTYVFTPDDLKSKTVQELMDLLFNTKEKA